MREKVRETGKVLDVPVHTPCRIYTSTLASDIILHHGLDGIRIEKVYALRTALRPSTMQRNQLRAKQIVSRRHTTRHGEVMPPLIRNHRVDRPLPIAQAVVRDFEPLQAGSAG